MLPRARTGKKKGAPGALFPRAGGPAQPTLDRPYFTPCISRWISGAIRNSSTPHPSSAQNPKV